MSVAATVDEIGSDEPTGGSALQRAAVDSTLDLTVADLPRGLSAGTTEQSILAAIVESPRQGKKGDALSGRRELGARDAAGTEFTPSRPPTRQPPI